MKAPVTDPFRGFLSARSLLRAWRGLLLAIVLSAFVCEASTAGETCSASSAGGLSLFGAIETDSVDYYPMDIAFGDVNGDGTRDAVVTSDVNNLFRVLIGHGDGSFAWQSRYWTAQRPESISLGDLNNDGNLDVVTTGDDGPDSVSVLMGYGNGSFASRSTYSVGSDPRKALLGDLNGDGALDVVTANGGDDTVSVLLGQGDGSFSTYVPYAGSGSIALGDLNGDEIIDLVVVNSERLIVRLGEGDGSFHDPVNYATGGTSVATGDLNGDGIFDVAVSREGDGTLFIRLSTGNGTLLGLTSYPASGGSIALGDINADGVLDVVSGNRGTGAVTALLGQCDGTLLPQGDYSIGNDPRILYLEDLNTDGAADLAAPNYGSHTLSVRLGVPTTDVDGDGIPDDSDNCPDVANGNQENSDADALGDVCDMDDDGDGVPDSSDAFPVDAAETTDTDGDGTGNNADLDDDGDGTADASDDFPLDDGEDTDTDEDGTGNNADPDDDGDGVPDTSDDFPLDASEDTDTDGDGVGDTLDNCPYTPNSAQKIAAWGADIDGSVSGAPGQSRYKAIAAGDSLSLALDYDGRIVAWGSDEFGQVSEAPEGGGHTAIAAGDDHGVALSSDGSLVVWGKDTQETPAGAGHTAIAAATGFSVALTADGSLVAWGADVCGVVSEVPAESGYTAIAAGGNAESGHGLALGADGSVVAWGCDNVRQVSGAPTELGFMALSAGDYHSVALRDDGSSIVWGGSFTSAFYAGLGSLAGLGGTGKAQKNSGLASGNDTTAIAQDAEGYTAIATRTNLAGVQTLALRGDGSLASWGGASGARKTSDLPSGNDYTAIAAGRAHSLALRGAGGQADTDEDGVGDACDAFPNDASESTDTDGDGVGDNADVFPNDASETADSDGDGVGDNGDAFPNDASETVDTDGDGVGDNTDPYPSDADNDGTPDAHDAFPANPGEAVDTDGDGIGNNADNCPADANFDQANLDEDSAGDVCDADDDNDGFTDAEEAEAGSDPQDESSTPGLDYGLVAHYPFSGDAEDQSGHANDGVVNGAALVMDRFGLEEAAYYFDGSSNIVVSTPTGLDFINTVSAWVKLDSHSGYQYVADLGAGNNNWIEITPDGIFRTGNDNGPALDTAQTVVGEWIMLTRSYDGVTMRAYADGVLVGSLSNPQSIMPTQIAIGSPGSFDGGFLNGSIDDVRVYERALSDSEVSALYALESTPPENPADQIDASLKFATNLFGIAEVTIVNPLAIDVREEVGGALDGRSAAFEVEITLSAGTYLGVWPSVGPAGSGADIEVGDALGAGTLSEWDIEFLAADSNESQLVYSLTPSSSASLVGAGTLLSVAPESFLIDGLASTLAVPGAELSLQFDFVEPGGLGLLRSLDAKIVQTILGVDASGTPSVSDVAGDAGEAGEIQYISNPITLSPQGYCHGFPDGGLFFSSPNCSADSLLQFDPNNDTVHVRVSGGALASLLEAPGSAVSINEGPGCDPATELASTDQLLPEVYSYAAYLDFAPPQASDASFVVCLIRGNDATFPMPQEVPIFVSMSFGSIFMLPSDEEAARFTIAPRCFGDLNNDYSVNNLDALLFRDCFGCSGPDCNRKCDYDLDGRVSNVDALAFRDHFGDVCEPPDTSLYPYMDGQFMAFGTSPKAVTLAAVASAGLLALVLPIPVRRRRGPRAAHSGRPAA